MYRAGFGVKRTAKCLSVERLFDRFGSIVTIGERLFPGNENFFVRKKMNCRIADIDELTQPTLSSRLTCQRFKDRYLSEGAHRMTSQYPSGAAARVADLGVEGI